MQPALPSGVSAAVFRGLFEAAPDGVVIVRSDGRIALSNAQALRMFGYPDDMLIGERVEILLPERLRAVHLAHRELYQRRPTIRAMGAGLSLVGRRRDGSEFPIEISLSPLETEDGTFTIAAIRDITDRQRAEREFRNLLEAAPDAMVIVDRRGRILLINTQTERLFGYDRADLLGAPVEVLVPARFRGRHEDYREGYFHASGVRPMGAGLDLYGLRKDGSEFPVEISLSPLETQHGLVVTAAVRDISERRRIEARISALNEDLERRVTELAAVNRDLEAFSAAVAHDLRAPLRAIAGFSEALEEECAETLGEVGRDYLRRVRTNADRMGELIEALLRLSRVSRQDMRFEPVDLSALARQILGRLHAAEPDRTAEVMIAHGLIAAGDGALLRVLLENLLGNAWKFTSNVERARIELGGEATGGVARFFVRDNGVGFDPAYRERLFEAFQRLHSATQFPGTGIGLATVRRIVDRHGGRVWAESTVGRGATFFFTLAPAG